MMRLKIEKRWWRVMVKRIPPPTISGGVVGIPAGVKFFFRNHGPATNQLGMLPAVHRVRAV